jgi:methionine synthase I (cobalamin-dependent)
MNFLTEFNIFSLSKRINRPLILDGAMGSLLEQMGLTSKDYSWSAKVNLTKPEIVFQIHKDYITAGADIITSNTFRTNPYALKQVGIDSYKNYVKKALSLAIEAKENLPVLIAGSNPPAEDSYQSQRKATYKELEINHCNHIDSLMENGADFILNETQSHFDEIKIICQYCNKNKIPFIISLYFTNELKLLSGEKVFDAITFINDFAPLCISFNCITNSLFNKFLSEIEINFNWGFYLNIWKDVEYNSYANLIKDKMKLLPCMVGGCCGSKPEDIKSIKEFLDGRIIL